MLTGTRWLCARRQSCIAGAKWLGVTSVEEGIATRALCPGARVLIMSGIAPGQAAAAIQFELTPIAWELWQLDELEAAGRAAGAAPGSVPVHLEIDTGMSRQGVLPGELAAIFARFASGSPLRLEGVMTHLFAADEADGQITREQLACLDGVLARISAAGLFAEWLSVGASAALLAGQAQPIAELAERHGMKALLRPGLALYGVVPEFDPAFDASEVPSSLAAALSALKPVLTWKSSVVGVRSIPAGATSATTQPSSPPSPCVLLSLPRATQTGSIARSAIAWSLWCAANARRWWAASAWISRWSMLRRFLASQPAMKWS